MTPENVAGYVLETYAGTLRGHPDVERFRPLLVRAAEIAQEEPTAKPIVAELATALAAQIIPSPAGWRLAVVGPDADLDACPIVAWQTDGNDPIELLPIARLHGQDGYGVATWANRYSDVIGLLGPGETLEDAGWHEEAEAHGRRRHEAEEREARK